MNTTMASIEADSRPSWVALPCIFFWCMIPIIIYDVRTSRNKVLPWSTLMSLKWFVASLLFVDRLFVLILAVWEALFQKANVDAQLFVYPFVHTVTILATLVATNEVRRAGIHSSGPLFCTWLLFFAFAIPEFYSWVQIGSVPAMVAHVDFSRYVAYLTYFPLVTIMFSLHFVSDPFPYASKNEKCPEEDASFISRQFLMWFSPLMRLGSQRSVQMEDVYELENQLDLEFLKIQWSTAWRKELKRTKKKALDKSKKMKQEESEKTPFLTSSASSYGSVEKIDEKTDPIEPSIISTLWSLLKWELIGISIIKFASDLLSFANPIFLNLLITFIETPSQSLWIGIGLALGLFISGQFRSLFLNYYFITTNRLSIKIQLMLTTAVYDKALKLSNASRRDRTTGEIVNLMAIDVDRFRMITPQLQQYWSSPLQIIFCMVALYQVVGHAVWAGVVIMISIIPINFAISITTKKWQMQLMKLKDERIRLTNEVLNGIKVVKLSAWELAMEEAIEKIRHKELTMIKKSTLLKTVSDSLNVAAPILVAVVSFTVFTFMNPNNALTPQIAFVSLSLFSMLRGPLMMAADLVAQTVQTIVSNKRLKTFMNAKEIDEGQVDKEDHAEMYHDSVEVHTAAFTWDDKSRFLKDIDLKVATGELVAVVGSVGSGKSSLLLAILGEMDKVCGYVGIRGTIAYLPQQAWVLNQTFKQNIIMQSPFNEVHYDRIINACALKEDVKLLPDGDATEIGEKGINLSGGQKARVGLARAAYQNKDVYLLDDPLAAVDAHVAKHIFDNVIGSDGLLSHTTRILVTNCTSFLKMTDRIIVMKDGRITHFDTYDNLATDEEARKYLHEVDLQAEEQRKSVESEESEKESDSVVSKLSKASSLRRKKSTKSSVMKQTAEPRKLIEKEEAKSGKVKFGIYMSYFKAMGVARYVLPYVFAVVIYSGLSMFRSIWLSNWSDANLIQTNADQIPVFARLGIFSAVGITEVMFVFISLVLLLLGGVAASRNLHRPLLHNILRSPLAHFDVTPIGRMINRLAKDMEVVDLRLSSNFRFLAITFMNMSQTIIIVTYSTPLFILVMVPILVIYFFIFRYSIKCSRQLQRLNSLSRSPIYSNFSETIQGIITIRSFDWRSEFVRRNDKHVNDNAKCMYYSQIANRWLSVRLEFLGNIVILAAAALAILAKDWGQMTAGGIGLSVSYSLNITFMLNMFVRSLNDVEVNIVSVERIDEYTHTNVEEEWRMNGDRLPRGWPLRGHLSLENYSTRYRSELELVLKSINLDVPSGQKVGVCGRTGAGKSSLALALFRIVEASEGKIGIDDVDVRFIGLYDLRERITIIPQESVLFASTLRFNLDPTEQYTDEELWKALELANLKPFVEGLSNGLEHQIAESGENLSAGQRQLICLARALLRKSKILVLDEATAGIDNQTDVLVQATIRKEFADSTIITIAHRLNTIMDYDRIIVMDGGRIVEDGVPNSLLRDKSSKFFGLAKSSKLA